VDKAGSYRVVANLTKAIDYGIVKIAINDNQPIQVDRFFPSVDNDEIDLGTFDLKQGVNRLKVEIVGANENAIKRYMFGLDYLKLIAQP
jgi:sucrose-6-phosphate hydrolase SacC (GH32 family)